MNPSAKFEFFQRDDFEDDDDEEEDEDYGDDDGDGAAFRQKLLPRDKKSSSVGSLGSVVSVGFKHPSFPTLPHRAR